MDLKIERDNISSPMADYFWVVGVDNELIASNKKKTTKNTLITSLELVKMSQEDDAQTLTNTKEWKWLNLDGLGRLFLKINYGEEKPPVTGINLYRIKSSSGGKAISIPNKSGIVPVCIRRNNKRGIFKTKQRIVNDEVLNFYYGIFDITDYLEHDRKKEEEKGDEEQEVKGKKEKNKDLLWFCYHSGDNQPPLTKIEFLNIQIDPETGQPMKPKTRNKILPYTFNYPRKRCLSYDSRNILQRRFIPQVLSRYPAEDRSYYPFPENVSSFCMTHGLRFEKDSDKNQDFQSPKFFSFILTDQEGNRMYCSCLILKENPVYPNLQDSLKAFNITDPKQFIVSKALCIISHYSFTNSWKEFLRSIFSIQFAKTPIPMERYICNFVDEIPVPDKGNILVEYEFGANKIPFYIPIDQYGPYASSRDIEYTFKSLPWEDVLTAIIHLSLEK